MFQTILKKKEMLLTFIGRVTVMVSIVVVPILVPTRVGWLKKMKKLKRLAIHLLGVKQINKIQLWKWPKLELVLFSYKKDLSSVVWSCQVLALCEEDNTGCQMYFHSILKKSCITFYTILHLYSKYQYDYFYRISLPKTASTITKSFSVPILKKKCVHTVCTL